MFLYGRGEEDLKEEAERDSAVPGLNSEGRRSRKGEWTVYLPALLHPAFLALSLVLSAVVALLQPSQGASLPVLLLKQPLHAIFLPST